ncbi:hypothetical protein TNIN_353121 [Trichonephila inaurata madagascariensis]|uniref:Uncharacterized protein n=1 Tax=Trichonephila inaurata madagascariensis TaxID=2747483 RepID=A0A8X7CEF2_9ARAC|nr:hypothetical protein TNIN_353121 [Trichonephila inaurata madagascariensis]
MDTQHTEMIVERTTKRLSLQLNLSHQGMNVLQTNCFSYFGINFDLKLTWRQHSEMTVERTTKRLSLLKRIAGSKWGCSKTTLELAYKFTFCRSLPTAASLWLLHLNKRLIF